MKSTFSVVVTGQSLITQDIRHVSDDRFDDVVRFLKRSDVVFTNFESTILGRHGGWPTKGKYFGYSDPVVLDALKAIGFNALALANNHAFDLGPNGILSTLDEVANRGFLHAGIGADQTTAASPGRRRLEAEMCLSWPSMRALVQRTCMRKMVQPSAPHVLVSIA